MSEALELMAVAQEQQEAAAAVLAKLEQQQARLAATIEEARRAVADMSRAGDAAATVVGKAATAAMGAALGGVEAKAGAAIEGAAAPALEAIQKATQQATAAAGELRGTVGWVSWKWAGIMAASSAGALGAFFLAAWLIVPGAGELAELRAEKAALEANVADLEKRGGRIQLHRCGVNEGSGRLCARVSAPDAGTVYGSNGEKWLILHGY